MFRLYTTYLRHPIFASFTLFGIRKSGILSSKNFANKNWISEQKQAFYVAYRSGLILMYCCKVFSPEKSLGWFDRISDRLIKSKPTSNIQILIDRHNSSLGKELFVSMLPEHHRQFFEPSFFLEELNLLTENAKKVSSSKEIEKGKMARM